MSKLSIMMKVKEDAPKVAPIRIDDTEIYEHGEDDATAKGLENGVTATNLTQRGKKYAEEIGEHAKDAGKKKIVSSKVKRAVETAAIIAKKAGILHITNELLSTWNIGNYEGKKSGSFIEKEWILKPNEAPKGGESFNSFKNRMVKAYKYAVDAPKTEQIITHSKVTRAFKALRDNKGVWNDKTTKDFLSLKGN
jgi:broad specificity phosphatase PhoE